MASRSGYDDRSGYRESPQRFTTVKQYRIPREDDRSSIYDGDRSSIRGGSDARSFQETRIIRRDRSMTPEPSRRHEKEYRYERETERSSRKEPYELDRYTKTTEYYPPRAPVVVPREEEDYQVIRRSEVYDDRQIARREPSPPKEDYSYVRRTREVEETSPDRETTRSRRHRSSPSRRDYSSDDSMVYVKREIREGRDNSPHHRLHIAEGAIAGLGAAELIRHHRKKEGDDKSSGPGRAVKGLGAAAAGAVGAEVISRVKSRHRSKSRGPSPDDRTGRRSHRHRHHSNSRSRSRVKTLAGIGIGVVALAAAAGYAKHKSDQNKTPNPADRRSRSHHRRHSTSDTTAPPVDPNHANNRMAQAGLVGAAVAGLVERARSKSRNRDGRSRSHNRLKTGIPIAAAGLGSAAIAGLYEKSQAKNQQKALDEAQAKEARRERRKSRERGPDGGAPAIMPYATPYAVPYAGQPGAAASDPGLIEYGEAPVYSSGQFQDYYGRPQSQAGYYAPPEPAMYALPPEAAYAAPRVVETVTHERVARDERDDDDRRERSRSRRRDDSDDSDDEERRRRHRRRKSAGEGSRNRERSQSRVRELATAGLAAGAAAIGVTQYAKRQERKKAEMERERKC